MPEPVRKIMLVQLSLPAIYISCADQTIPKSKFCERSRNNIRRSNLAPQFLKNEITESISQNINKTLKVLNE
jgi:EAL domain-containing protein (putative c-di-GMP-specific phosphodiesterase class I)